MAQLLSSILYLYLTFASLAVYLLSETTIIGIMLNRLTARWWN